MGRRERFVLLLCKIYYIVKKNLCQEGNGYKIKEFAAVKTKSCRKGNYGNSGGNYTYQGAKQKFSYGVALCYKRSPEYCGVKQRRGQKRNRPKVICGKKHGACNTAGVAAGAYLKHLIKKNKKEQGSKICRKNCKHGL